MPFLFLVVVVAQTQCSGEKVEKFMYFCPSKVY